jgi:hypothetical protein
VRVLWLSALAVAVVAAWQLVEQLAETRATLYRIGHWTRIDDATIKQIGDSSRETYRVTVEELASKPVKVTYVDAKGVTHELTGKLTAQPAAVHPTKQIPILIDPLDPQKWTDQVQTRPLVEQMLIPLILFPLALVLALGAIWQRWRMLALWRDGEAREGRIVDLRHSAVAPRSNVLRCTIEGARDKRLLSVVVPRRISRVEPGDHLVLVIPAAGETNRAIAAMVYE